MALGFFRRRKADGEQPGDLTVVAETAPVETSAVPAREEPSEEGRPRRPRRGGESSRRAGDPAEQAGERPPRGRGSRSRAAGDDGPREPGTGTRGEDTARGGGQGTRRGTDGARRGGDGRRGAGGRRTRPEPSPGESRVELSAEHFEPLRVPPIEAAADESGDRPDMSRSRTRRGTRGGRGRGRGRRGETAAVEGAERASEEAPLDDTTPAIAELMGWTAEDSVEGPSEFEPAAIEEAEPEFEAPRAVAPEAPAAPAKPQPPRFEFGRRAPVPTDAWATETTEESPVTEAPTTEERAPEAAAPEAVEAGALLETPPELAIDAAAATEQPIEAVPEAAPEDPKPRGRRGGRRSTKAVEEEAATQPEVAVALEPSNGAAVSAPAPSPAVSPDGFRRLEELVARQTAALQAMQAQLSQTMVNMDRSLVLIRDSLRQRSEGQTARVGVFVDVANIELEARKLETSLDWGKVLEFLERGRWLVSAVAYAPVTDDREVSIEANPFVHPFLDKGFRIVSKEIRRLPGGDIKANFDVEMAIDVLSMAERLDVVCLITGDGDFTYLVERLQARGIRVEVAAFPRNTSRTLRLAADSFYDIRTCARGSR